MPLRECIFISGTSRGLGLQLAKEYVNLGCTVIGCSRGESAFNHDMYHHYKCDITDEENVKAIFSDIRTRKLNPKILINNASIDLMSIFAVTKIDDANRVLKTNLLGSLLISREMIKLMQRNGFGRIINFSSICVSLGSVGSAIYSASKAGVEAMAYSLANECKSFDITVNTLGISYVENTGMYDAKSEKVIASLKGQLFKPDFLKVIEIVKAIDFLGAPEAKNITGQTIYFGGVR